MDRTKEVKQEIENLEKDVFKVYDMALNTIERNYKREHDMVRYLMVIIGILLFINGYFAYIFTTTSVVEYSQEGIYNFVDSDGNIVSSDLSLEEMERLIELNGKNKSEEKGIK